MLRTSIAAQSAHGADRQRVSPQGRPASTWPGTPVSASPSIAKRSTTMPEIHRLLIANRGEIARRIIRTTHSMGIETVAVYSDADVNARHVHEATRSCALGGLASADSYLRIDKIVAAARASGADAVHPGYGFLSENADFAQAVIDAGLTWVGPPPAAIRALGSKSASKALALARGIPCLGGYFGPDQSDERLLVEARSIGFPVMVKAAAGGGGRGMRLVLEAGELLAAVRSARSEAESAFGNGELLIEKALLQPRHVEVQVFADTHGHCVHLGERDCSVQRRHQKLVEETPSPAIADTLRQRMGQCAVDLALAAGYVGAGTVEFLVEGAGADAAFFLMEMNTRLQVEHPVTEAVTGLDLVAWQLRVARGEALPLAQGDIRFKGHAIEVRLCAEDEHFAPHSGTVLAFEPPPGADESFGQDVRVRLAGLALRFDHALAVGGLVSPYYDSMLGKLIVHAPTRLAATERLADALDQLVVLGLPTNRALLAAILRHPSFVAGQALIPFLQQQGAPLRESLQDKEQAFTDGCPLEAVLFQESAQQPGAGGLTCPYPRPVRLRHRGRLLERPIQGVVAWPEGLRAVALRDGRWHAQQDGTDAWVDDASFDPPAPAGGGAGVRELRAPFNGKVVAVLAQAEALLAKGDPVLIIESMKLEHRIAAPAACRVGSLTVAAGQQVSTGQVLARLEAQQAP